MPNIRVRFAPSPTGFLHIGNLRVALFDYLVAKSLSGKIILRIEDTDQKREVPGAVDSLINILEWSGIKFDEGPHLGGDYGPYIQSQRSETYKQSVDQLLKIGRAYRCFCTPERLDRMRREQETAKQPPRYDRICRNLTEAEISNKIKAGEKFVIRQKMPLDGETAVHDELKGEIKFNNADLDDQILIKCDGVPTYQFASVVDDHLMAISHVLRGDEWISSFPKNILLYRAFGWTPPKFIHLPLILNKGGGKLSKRQGDVAVEDFRAQGYLPEALLNFMVLLGWHPRDDKEILSLDEMIKEFKIEDMGTSPAVFDIAKLDYFNGWHIRHKSPDVLAELCLPFLTETHEKSAIRARLTGNKNKFISKSQEFDFEYIKKVVALEQERLKKLSEIGELTEFFFADKLDYETELLVWKKLSQEQVKKNLQSVYEQLERIPEKNWTDDSIEEDLSTYIKAKSLGVGDMLWPTRVALTGRKASPGPFETAEVLGKKESLKRIKEAVEKLEASGGKENNL